VFVRGSLWSQLSRAYSGTEQRNRNSPYDLTFAGRELEVHDSTIRGRDFPTLVAMAIWILAIRIRRLDAVYLRDRRCAHVRSLA
jgi:hypothetical protein